MNKVMSCLKPYLYIRINFILNEQKLSCKGE